MKNSYSRLPAAAIAGVLAAAVVAAVDPSAVSAQSAKAVAGSAVKPAAGSAVKPPAASSNKSAAASSDEADATYTWSAELVSFDAAHNAITVKASLVANPEADDRPGLKAGDHATLAWSGVSTAAGVRAVQRGSKSTFDRMTMPIDYVSADGPYLVFKVPIPPKDAAAIAKLSPGTYVTATSPLQAKKAADAVIAIKPYNESR
jgi:hypothetical protein